ncbi:MAG: serine/threonine protein kinase [Chloroflexi bacterium]|nr:serine/threonine protein kinase [Chloroflexota bacterium]
MGSVYRAWDMRLSVPVALKEMTSQPGLGDQTLGQLRQQFQQEATVLARLHHPHLVRVTDFFEEADNAYLVMDFVEGKSLADRITQRGPLPESEVLAWAKQLLSALTYCHDQGIIHRDIKPQNVVIRPDGQAVLVDFGLVKLWDPNDPRTKTVMRGVGTPEYSPPEQYEADTAHTDPRSDIYSMGATMYHAVAGQAPLTATLRMASPERFVPMRKFNPGVRSTTEAVVLRALELNQSKRWQSANEMASALKIGAPPTPTPGRVTPATPKRDEVKATPSVQAAAPARRRVPWAWLLGCSTLFMILFCFGSMQVLRGLARQGRIIQTSTAQSEVIMHQAQGTATAQAQATSTTQAVEAASTVQAQATTKAKSTATAAAQAQATVPPQDPATATVQACIHDSPLAPTDWPIIFCDTFNSNENDWYTGEYDGDLISGEKLITDGKYRWDATVNEDAIWWSIPDVTLDNDFYLTVKARRISGVENGQYGLIFRKSDKDNYAIFKLQDDSSFKFSLRHEGEWDTVIDWTETSAARPNKVNRVTVIAQGASYTFYVNDQYVGEAQDDRLSQGQAGMVIELVEAKDTAIFEFDNLEMRAP